MNTVLILQLLLISTFSFFIIKNWSIIGGLWMRREFAVNDYVLLNGGLTMVKEVGFKNLILEIKNNRDVLIPLKNIARENIINLSKNSTPFKAHLVFKTCNKIEVKEIENVLLQIMEAHTLVIDTPKPYISIVGLRNENMVFHLYFHTYHSGRIDEIENELKIEIMNAFEEKNITHLLRRSNFSVKEKTCLSNN